MKQRAEDEYTNNRSEIIYNEYLSFKYPESYNKEYVKKIEKNKKNIEEILENNWRERLGHFRTRP